MRKEDSSDLKKLVSKVLIPNPNAYAFLGGAKQDEERRRQTS